MQNKTILITGIAGFIGFHAAHRFMAEGYRVIGLDEVNDYYDPSLKEARLMELDPNRYTFYRVSLEDAATISRIFETEQIDLVLHLAAQAGVRYSIDRPDVYITSNIVGFLSILEACRHYPVEQLIYASSSSVYGSNTKMPFATTDAVDHPLSLYAASKKANELMAHTYSSLYGIKTTGLRFFSVYGPWGRPDMALFKFTEAIAKGQPIDLYNYGEMGRDFTYVDDIIESIYRLMQTEPVADSAFDQENPLPDRSNVPYRVFNIGSHSPIRLNEFVALIEERLGKKAIKHEMPLQAGDVPESFADVESLFETIGYRPQTTIEAGVHAFIDWYEQHYRLKEEVQDGA
ncbi:NAD-dependent epimerase [Exiguobacterium sp. Helios]|uniref:NAD-dependent epimerase n=1 Tax=Exiguobacterium sp. Helios TaxID=2735868 RepID=UPI00165DA61E|nr:NAD-dependent epimerase [Exiguobacterium sp. Helios]QNR22124.1 NAD-dependent epimerase [Exiguobacterium sp. Helios]